LIWNYHQKRYVQIRNQNIHTINKTAGVPVLCPMCAEKRVGAHRGARAAARAARAAARAAAAAALSRAGGAAAAAAAADAAGAAADGMAARRVEMTLHIRIVFS